MCVCVWGGGVIVSSQPPVRLGEKDSGGGGGEMSSQPPVRLEKKGIVGGGGGDELTAPS